MKLKKFIIIYGIMLALLIIVVIPLFSARISADKQKDSAYELATNFKDFQISVFIQNYQLKELMDNYIDTGNDSYYEEYNQVLSSTDDNPYFLQIKEIDQLDEVVSEGLENYNALRDLEQEAYELSATNSNEAAKMLYSNEYVSAQETLNNSLGTLNDTAQSYLDSVINTAEALSTKYNTIMGIYIVIAFGSVCVSLMYIYRKFKLIDLIVKAGNDMTKGVVFIDPEIFKKLKPNNKDELGDLTRSLIDVSDLFNSLLVDINTLASEHEKGNIDYIIDSSKYVGAYKEVADSVSKMSLDYSGMIKDITNILSSYANGNFSYELPKYKGEKAKINDAIVILKNNLNSINEEIMKIADGVTIEGTLRIRGDIDSFNGEWANIVMSLNSLLDNIVRPMDQTVEIINDMSEGYFNIMEGEYLGEFDTLKNTVNNTVLNIKSYINETIVFMTNISNGDLRQRIEREYVGEFDAIRTAINATIDNLRVLISKIDKSAEDVIVNSTYITESSYDVANNSSTQMYSIDALVSKIENINALINENASVAEKANHLTVTSKEEMLIVNEEMNNMLQCMEDINTSSSNINDIIKVIEDIAFQTNLLALNAAVEAARASQHGKGFAVVAEEVRNLASRTQVAAKETSKLIEASTKTVDEGTKKAQLTAESLNKVVDDINQVSSLISDISEVSKGQTSDIEDISSSVKDISKVTEKNSTSSENFASTAQEFNSQSTVLKETVSNFKL